MGKRWEKVSFYFLILVILIGSVGAIYYSLNFQITGQHTENVEQTPGTALCDEGVVTYDENKRVYRMKVRGMVFPFRSDPCKTVNVKIDSTGDPATELVEALLNRDVNTVTLLTDVKDGDKSIEAADEIYSYLSVGRGGNIVRAKTEKTETSTEVASLDDANPSNSIVYLKGPNAGAVETKIIVGGNKIIVEGETYKNLVKASDRIVLEMAAVFCGSSACKDPVGCAAGKSCGCQ